MKCLAVGTLRMMLLLVHLAHPSVLPVDFGASLDAILQLPHLMRHAGSRICWSSSGRKLSSDRLDRCFRRRGFLALDRDLDLIRANAEVAGECFLGFLDRQPQRRLFSRGLLLVFVRVFVHPNDRISLPYGGEAE